MEQDQWAEGAAWGVGRADADSGTGHKGAGGAGIGPRGRRRRGMACAAPTAAEPVATPIKDADKGKAEA